MSIIHLLNDLRSHEVPQKLATTAYDQGIIFKPCILRNTIVADQSAFMPARKRE